MYAIVRRNTYDPAKAASDQHQLSTFDDLHARQPGFRGTLSIDTGDGSQLVLNVWDSEAAAKAGLEALRPAVRDLIEPVLAKPSDLIGEGAVVSDTLLDGIANA
jgi:heme-degrading monooxygenase HmoA